MSLNVNGRFEYETCCRKICSSVVVRGSKNSCLNVCYDLREQVGYDPQILSKVVTGDETWCYGYNPEKNKHQANGKHLILQKQRRPDRLNQMLRSYLFVFFYANEIVHKEFVPPGPSVNQQCYLKVLKRLRGSVWEK